MGFNIGKAISGAVAGLTSGGGWAGAAAGGLLGGLSGDDSANAEQAYNRQLNDSIKLWNMQNAYNDPVAQMQRLEKAGLNKYLVYSSGNVTGNSSSSINQPTLSYAQSNNQPLNNFLRALNMRSAKAETEGKEVDTESRELDLQLKKLRIAKMLTGGNNSAVKLLPIEKERANVAAMTTAERRAYWNKQRDDDQYKKLQRSYMLQYYKDREDTNAYKNSFVGRTLSFVDGLF